MRIGPDIPALVSLYAKYRQDARPVLAELVESAERIGRRILDTYLEPDRSFLELREMVKSGSIDVLRDFSEVCRAEFESLATMPTTRPDGGNTWFS
jgi:hypothetical protein